MSGTTDEHTGAMADDDTFNAFPLAQAEQVGNSVVLLRNVGASLQRRPRGVGLDHGVVLRRRALGRGRHRHHRRLRVHGGRDLHPTRVRYISERSRESRRSRSIDPQLSAYSQDSKQKMDVEVGNHPTAKTA